MKKKEPGMTEKELEEIQKRCEEVTSGPWIWFVENPDPPYGPFVKVVSPRKSGNIEGLRPLLTLNDEEFSGQKNADFVCRAKEDIPKLLNEIKRLKGILKKFSEIDIPRRGDEDGG